MIRPYDPDHDEPAAHALWERALGDPWPLSRETFRRVTVDHAAYEAGDHLVWDTDDRVVGFAGTQTRKAAGAPNRAELMLVMVDPGHRRRGIGRALHDEALAGLRRRGVDEVQLGAGGITYFWPGVPFNLPDAWSFFKSCGWSSDETTYDLVRELGDYATPPEVTDRARAADITLAMAAPDEFAEAVEFEAAHLPSWRLFYEQAVEGGRGTDIVLARDPEGRIVGTSMVGAPAPAGDYHAVWSELLGPNTGGVGPLGVAQAARGRGVGMAIAAKVTEELRARGVRTSYVGYTWLVDWYGRLGYRVWREYRVSRMRL